jgi:O-antigen/teichoic acid export membrane protein
MLFPLITFPYASRIMQADGIGQVNFFQSIIGYISLFTCLGIPMYAVRAIARVRDDVKMRNRVAMEILSLHLSLSFIGYIIVGIVAFFVPQVQSNIPLFFLLSLSILFTTIGCDWFYQGIEDFKYIAIRGVVIKILSVAILFITVKTKNDLMWYGFYSVFGTLGGNIFNFFRLRKYNSEYPISVSDINIIQHIKPIFHVSIFTLIVSVYLNLNVVMLGLMKNNEAVGLFSAATKITSLCLGIVGAMQSVLIPQMSNLLALGKRKEFAELSQKSLSFSLFISLPMTVGIILTAPYLIPLLAGPSYSPAILVLQIMAGVVLMSPISGVFGLQILYPLGKEKLVVICAAVSAVINVVLNIVLIPRYSYTGVAVSTLFTESVNTVIMIVFAKSYSSVKWNCRSNWNYLLASVVMGGLVWLFQQNLHSTGIGLFLISVSVGFISYFSILFLRKDQVSELILQFAKRKL